MEPRNIEFGIESFNQVSVMTIKSKLSPTRSSLKSKSLLQRLRSLNIRHDNSVDVDGLVSASQPFGLDCDIVEIIRV